MPKLSLTAARVNAGYTQKQVAKRLNVSISTIKNWEKGITFPKQPMIEALCELYNIMYDYLDFSGR